MQQQHAQQSPHLKGQGQGSPHTVFFDRKVDLITAGLQPRYNKYLKEERQISRENALVICDYILAMKTEINPSNEYRKTTIQVLIQFLKFLPKSDQKSFSLATREDILAFLDSLRKPESLDPMHKWIGTYNLYNIQLTRFFKWLYSPDIEPVKRQKPKVIENVPKLKRKEKSVYKPDDLWTNDEDLL